MKVAILKFGGTSLQTTERVKAAAEIIRDAVNNDFKVVAVASAMGHTTDHLLSLTDGLDTHSSLRELDMLLASGEQISASLLAMAVNSAGLPAVALTGAQAGIFTDNAHGSANIIHVAPVNIISAMREAKVVVVTGYQGVTQGGDITTLGRGGSDTTAIALAHSLRAHRCDIYSDVNGIYSADPAMIPSAKLLPAVTPRQMVALAQAGAQVMCETAVELAERWGVEFRVRSAFNSENEGTLVSSTGRSGMNGCVGIACERAQDIYIVSPAETLEDLESVSEALRSLTEAGIRAEALQRLGRHRPSIAVALGTRHVHDNAKTLTAICTKFGLKAEFRRTMSKISVVGPFESVDTTLASVRQALLCQKICPLYWTLDKDIRLSVVVRQNKMLEAAAILHETFMASNLVASA